jgi:cbb3-type cytochrome oxidase subunit 1
MPKISRVLLSFSLIYLVLGAFFGLLVGIGKVFPELSQKFLSLVHIHINFMIFGFFFNFILAVGYWIFPRLKEGTSRGNTFLYVASFFLLNFALIFDAVNFLFLKQSRFFVFSLLIFLSLLIFIFGSFRRIKPPPFGEK